MGQIKLRWILLLAMFLALPASGEFGDHTDDGRYLAGMGLHEETGRNIYLGGLYLDEGTPRPTVLTGIAAPWTMEYRVVARRTSIRSLLGGILLQSEVATGRMPEGATPEFADAILSSVQTPLYAGDALTIRLDAQGTTVAALNGYELARVADASVAEYLLQGWIGETGPTTAFRSALLAETIDPALMAMLESTSYSTEREAEVAAWFNPPDQSDVAATDDTISPAATDTDSPAAELAIAAAEVAESSPTAIEAPVAEPAAAAEPATTMPADTPEPAGEALAATAPAETGNDTNPAASAPPPAEASQSLAAADPAALSPGTADAVAKVNDSPAATPLPVGTQTAEDAIQVASLSPVSLMGTPDDDVLSLGLQEYFQRLSKFHGAMVAMVYKQIRYPARAVRRNLEGRVELDVTIQPDGALLDVAIAQTSGHRMLDAAAVSAAESAFSAGGLGSVDPVAEAEFGSGTGTLVVPIPVSFKLTD